MSDFIINSKNSYATSDVDGREGDTESSVGLMQPEQTDDPLCKEREDEQDEEYRDPHDERWESEDSEEAIELFPNKPKLTAEEDRIHQRALDNVRPLVRYLGEVKPALFSVVDFVPHDQNGLINRPVIMVDEGMGRWEEKADQAAYGWDLISLIEHVRGVSRDIALNVLVTFLDALERDVGWECMPEFDLCQDQNAKQLALVPRHAPSPPDHWGRIIDDPVDYPLYSPSGRLLGYTREVTIDGNIDNITKLPLKRTFPLTCWQRRDGSLGWKNQHLVPPYHLYGIEKLALDTETPVFLTDDEASAEYGVLGISAEHDVAIGVGFISAPNSVARTDLRPLGGRTVYIQLTSVGDANAIREMLWRINPLTRVGIITISLDKYFCPIKPKSAPGGELIPDTPGKSLGWRVRDYLWAASENGWKFGYTVEKPIEKSVQAHVGNIVSNANGIFHVKFHEGEEVITKLASRIDFVAKSRNGDSAEWGACLKFRDHDNVLHSWCVPFSTLYGSTDYCKTLSGMGAYVSPYGSNMQKLTDFLLNYEPGHRARAVSKPGWEKNQFIFPDGSHVGYSDEMISYQTADPSNNAFGSRGTLDEWKKNVAALCEGNSRMVLAIATALTGPVLPLLGEESGGFHFPGESSTGKTTALHPACSVWGRPENFIVRWRGTANGIEATASQRNHTLIALDEMSQVSPEEAGQIVYMLANGQGKARARQDATARAISTWQLMFLSTGEVGLEQHMAVAGLRVMAGQQTRLIDIPANVGRGHGIFENIHGSANGAEFSIRVKSLSAQYFGVAGRAWVNALADPKDRAELLANINDRIDARVQRVEQGADGQVRRVARRFALVAAVAEACVDLGILPWPPGHASNEIQRCFDEWVVNRGSLGNLESEQAISCLRRYLAEFGESAFTAIGDNGIDLAAPDRVTIRRVGFREIGGDGITNYYIFPEMFRNVICAGVDSKQMLRHLRQANVLVLDPRGKPQVVKRPPGMPPTRFYHVRSTVLAEPERPDSAGVTQIETA